MARLESIWFWKSKPDSLTTVSMFLKELSKCCYKATEIIQHSGNRYIFITQTIIYNPARPNTLIQLSYAIKKRNCSNLHLKSDLKSYSLLVRISLEYLSVKHSFLQHMEILCRQQENQAFALEDVGDLWLLVNKDSGEYHS